MGLDRQVSILEMEWGYIMHTDISPHSVHFALKNISYV